MTPLFPLIQYGALRTEDKAVIHFKVLWLAIWITLVYRPAKATRKPINHFKLIRGWFRYVMSWENPQLLNWGLSFQIGFWKFGAKLNGYFMQDSGVAR